MPDRPSANELERFLLGTLPPADAARVSEWVSAAPEAAETLRGLAATDPFTASLKVVLRADREQLSTSSPGPEKTVTQTHEPVPTTPMLITFPPVEVGGFRVVRELGRGGMGAVFEATDPGLGRKVALKMMLPEVAVHPQARARFLREARAAARVEHESIVPIYQVGEANGVPYIAMPLLVGESLDTRLKSASPLPLADVLLLGRQVAEGLAAAHAAGMIHRDIKPSNIWLNLNPNGSVRRIYILDFGLARAPGDAVLTGAGDILGTPAYMSVEQARGQLVDFRTDLYSLGVVLYQAATGRRPFDGATAYAVLAALAVHTPPAPVQVNPAVPPALSTLIVKLMNKTPAGRPQSARGVADELVRIANLRAPAPVPTSGTKVAPALPAVPPAAPPPPRPTPVPPPLPVMPPPRPTTDTVVVASEPISTLPDAPDPVPEPEPLPLDTGFSVERDVTELFQPEPLPLPESEPSRPRRRLLIGIGAAVAAGLLIAGVLAVSGGKNRKDEEQAKKDEPADAGKDRAGQVKGKTDPFVRPETVTLPEGDQGTPNDPSRKLAVWVHSQGWTQSMLVWNDGWIERTVYSNALLPNENGRWKTMHATMLFDKKRPMTEDDLKQFSDPALAISTLTISGPEFTDEWLDKLTRLPFAQKLALIALSDTAVTDMGLQYLTRCKNVGGISLSGPGFTRDGANKLRNTVPTTVTITANPTGAPPTGGGPK